MQTKNSQPMVPVSPELLECPPVPTRTAVRYEFLDGLRGLAAALVVVHHIPAFCTAPRVVVWLGLGNPWVAIFITLSGFCLYLPSAGRETVEMPRPFGDFMKRRARRILPAWYASLALCILTGVFFAAMRHTPPFNFLPLDAWDVLTHLSLTHSLFKYSGSINGPGYTLGTEWQLYLLMLPFLWLVRRIGWAGILTIAALIAVIPHPIFDKVVARLVSSTFTLPFLLGMLGARLVSRLPNEEQKVARHRVVAAGLTLAGIAGYAGLTVAHHDLSCWCVGVATAAACFYMARTPLSVWTRGFSARPMQSLGAFSYSLYLTHFPLLALLQFAGVTLGLSGERAFFLLFLPGNLVIFAVAYLFYRLFEKPFLAQRRTRPNLAQTGSHG